MRPLRRFYAGINQSQRVKPLLMLQDEIRRVYVDSKSWSGLKGLTLTAVVWESEGGVTISDSDISDDVAIADFTADSPGIWWVKAVLTFNNGEKYRMEWRVDIRPAFAAFSISDGNGGDPNTPPEPTLGEVEFEYAAYSVVGDPESTDVVVVRHNGPDGPATVLYATSNGTLIAGVDYVATSGTLFWDALDASNRTITIPLLGSPIGGNFNVTLTSPTGMVLGDIDVTVVSILGAGLISFVEPVYYVTDDESVALLQVQRTDGTRGAASADYDTADMTGTAPENYTQTSGTSNWADLEDGIQPVVVPIEPLPIVEELAADVLLDWGTDNDPRLAEGAYEYRFEPPGPAGPVGWTTSYPTVLEEVEAYRGFEIDPGVIAWSILVSGSGLMGAHDDLDPEQKEVLHLRVNHSTIGSVTEFFGDLSAAPSGGFGSGGFDELFFAGVSQNELVWWTGQDAYTNVSGIYTIRTNGGQPTTPSAIAWDGLNNCVTAFGCPYTNGLALYRLSDSSIEARRIPQAPEIPGSEFPDWELDPDNFWYDEETETLYSKQPYVQTSGSYRWLSLYAVAGSDVVRKPLGPVLEVGDPNDTEAFWTAARDAAIVAGALNADLITTYNAAGTGGITTFPRNMTYAHRRTYKLPVWFSVGLSNGSGATIVEPDEATVYILPA